MKKSRNGFLDPKGRRDHIAPRVYLRGFIHPDRDQKDGGLEVFDLSTYHWGEPRSADELCVEIGFYDYSVDFADETADDAFEELEGGLAEIRRKLRSDRFLGWKRYRSFLVRFAHMLVVRSKLFREGVIRTSQRQEWLRVLEVSGNTIRFEPFDPKKEPDADLTAKNLSITAMRTEIQKGAGEWEKWRWGLFTAPHVLCPFISSDAPVVMDGPVADGTKAFAAGTFRVVVPFGWDFALVGSPTVVLPEGPQQLTVEEMDELRVVTASGAGQMLISPARLPDMRWFGRVRPAVPLMPS
jgi:Protein of unknown function (DUF4238)